MTPLEVVFGLAALLLSIVTFVIGQRRGELRERRRLTREQHRAARRFAAMARPIVRELRRKLDHFDRVDRGTGQLIQYFSNESALMSDHQVGALRTVIDVVTVFDDQSCADAWSEAANAVVEAHEEHERLLDTATLSETDEFRPNGAAYRRLLEATLAAMTSALERTTRHAALDTREAMYQLIEGT